LAHAGETLVFGALDAAFSAIVKESPAKPTAAQELHPRDVRGLRYFSLASRSRQEIIK
jgi:hypothetical protein